MMSHTRKWMSAGLMAGVLIAVSLPVRADDDGANYPMGMMGGMGRGMMGGVMGMGGGMGMMGGGPYHLLNLSDDQRSKINKIQDDERRKHWETMGKVMDERAKLRDLTAADKRDIPAILKVQEQIDLYQRKMLELHLNTHNQVDALLTKEQREQLKSMHRGGMGMGGGMMGPGGMGGGRGMMR